MIECAPQTKIIELSAYVDIVLQAFDTVGAWVSDESRVSDFLQIAFDKNDILKHLEVEKNNSNILFIASNKLGFDINKKDLIWQLADRLKHQ